MQVIVDPRRKNHEMTDWTPQPFPFEESVPVESQLAVTSAPERVYPNAYAYHMDQYLHGDPNDRAGHAIAAVFAGKDDALDAIHYAIGAAPQAAFIPNVHGPLDKLIG